MATTTSTTSRSLADRLVDRHLNSLPTEALLLPDSFFIGEITALLTRSIEDRALVVMDAGIDPHHVVLDGGRYRGDRLASCIDGASTLRTVTRTVIPARLQTDAYRGVVRAACAPAATTFPSDWRPRPAQPTTLMLDEFALLRPCGGPRVMAEQLRHLQALEAEGSVVVRILPADTLLPAPGGLFHEIVHPSGGPLYATEDGVTVLYQRGPHAAALRRYMDRYEQAALLPAVSRKRLAEAADAMEAKV
ncbi:Scr1 family TA system antitoxin-like transcriptional regulator [Streptomyces sp. DH12]|uniref:Scr1 family TA system antitoxin-like transcriptional regulator n=1 Tax=Streptomyces sp. DH12 TaxID=2857010 RepID=UPI001E543C0F|nr:Scr1 family TA system antitoxin-like transcriptional regulator [Streptomyces sp. DH12]